MIVRGVLLPSKLHFALGSWTHISFCLPDVVLQPDGHFDPGHEFLEIDYLVLYSDDSALVA